VITRADWPRRLNFVRSHPDLVVAKLSTVFALIGVLLWLRVSLKALTLYDSSYQTAAAALATKFEVGELKISLGGVLVLVFGTLLAVWLARTLRFVLDEDVLGRLDMNPGTREVSASGIFWAAILIGFFAVLAAAGIALDKLTVLAGALGVGIGFGLQNVVQNFAAGLILLFGRPIKVGDQIQLEHLIGEVRSIGFRASTVRTPQGAEVIVPNANLISNQVINWTLSDPKRRVDISIGVAYGVDPDRIVELLCDVGRSHEKVLKEPPIMALFMNHGESSLDFQLRAWVMFDDFVPVSSELAIAVNKRLTAEGIEIPFPQRDLNVRSVAPAVAKALGNRSSS
jgi:small-conductance mechanosensitive channel